MKILKKSLIVILVLLIIGFLAFSIFIGKSVFDGYTNDTTREETLENQVFFEESFQEIKDKYSSEELNIKSSVESHEIPGILLKKKGNKDLAVLIHGMGGTKITLPEEMDLFLEKGFDVILYDQRNSGENLAPHNTFGYLESNDALDVVAYGKDLYPNGKVLLYGESYGGITATIAAGRNEENIDLLVLDCPVSDGKVFLDEILKNIEKETSIPASYMYQTGNLYTRFKLGFSLNDTDGNKWIKNISKPILVLTSTADQVTPQMGEELFSSISHEDKIIETSEFAEHARILQEDSKVFVDALDEFLSKYK